MYLDTTIGNTTPSVPHLPYTSRRPALPGPDGSLPAHRSLGRVLGLLGPVNVRLSLFCFETKSSLISSNLLFGAVERAVDDGGLAFGLDDGRVGALVYGWRPPGAPDSWVEDRTLTRFDWAFGGPHSMDELIDVYSLHRWSSELVDSQDAEALLSLAEPVNRVRSTAMIA